MHRANVNCTNAPPLHRFNRSKFLGGMKMRILLACLAFAAAPAFAQDRTGNDTASDWRVKHYESFGIWTSVCDEREETGTLLQRCYIRWVDVFSLRPRFAGQFLFLTPDADGWKVEFGIEPGTLFSPAGFRIEQEGEAPGAACTPAASPA